MLKKIIYDEIGSNIEIDEGDGKPYDFIVRTSEYSHISHTCSPHKLS